MGSFINALVWRLRQQELASKKSKVIKFINSKLLANSKNRYSIFTGRSMCPDCKHQLAWYDLIPVLSWLSLRGKCRYCSKPISLQYPIVEILTAVVFSLAYANINTNTALNKILFALLMVQLTLLIALAVYDLRWFLLPNKLIYPLLAIGVVNTGFAAYAASSPAPVAMATAGFTLIGGLFWLIFQISNGKWLGGGDVKLAAYIGLLLGAIKAILAITLASYLALIIFGILLLLKLKSRRDLLPFGPFLILASFICLFWGQNIIDFYLLLSGLN